MITTLLGAILLTTGAPAKAANVHTYGCTYHQYSKIGYQFMGSGWDQVISSAGRTAASYAAEGMQLWNRTRGWDGTQLVDIQPVSVGGVGRQTVNLYYDDSPGNDPMNNGFAACGATDSLHIEMNPMTKSNAGQTRAVAAHELGHILGLFHVGQYASWDNVVPLMSTCNGSSGGLRDFSQDDDANLTMQKDALAPVALTANVSFERGLTYWGKDGGTLIGTSNGVDGAGSALFTPADVNSSVYSTTTLYDSAPTAVDLRVNFKPTALASSGYFAGQVQVAPVYPAPGSTCGYASGFDETTMAKPPATAFVTEVGQRAGIYTNWTILSSTSYAQPILSVVRLRIYDRLASATGSFVPVYLDNSRVRDVS